MIGGGGPGWQGAEREKTESISSLTPSLEGRGRTTTEEEKKKKNEGKDDEQADKEEEEKEEKEEEKEATTIQRRRRRQHNPSPHQRPSNVSQTFGTPQRDG